MKQLLATLKVKLEALSNPTTSSVLKDFEKTVLKLQGVSRFQKLRAKSLTDHAAWLQAKVANNVSKANKATQEAEMAEAAAARINKLLQG